jgi:eukaryotic-like serine/threonine-protein kinase
MADRQREGGLEAFLAEPVEWYMRPILNDIALHGEVARARAPRDLAAAIGQRYTIDSVIGVGGMATVYLAHDQSLGRAVAIKVLHPELGDSLGAGRFEQEIGLTARLEHACIAPVHARGDASGLLYFVMRYFKGGSLREHVERHGPLPIPTALAVARDVAEALDHAHAHGVVHRDVKPANILLEGTSAFVADFGIAQMVDAAGADRLTHKGVIMGTPEYMSPEQAEPGARLDGRSDVYSLGCVLYEMLAGEPPYTAHSRRAILAKHASSAVPDLSVLRSTVTPAMQRVIAKALQKSPADRYQTCNELIIAFAAAIEAAPAAISPRWLPPWAPARSATTAAANWRSTAVLIAALVIAAAAIVFTVGRVSDQQLNSYSKFEIALPDSVSLWPGWGKTVAITRDASRMLFVGERHSVHAVYIQALNGGGARLVRGTEGASSPEFSQDGRWIVFAIAGLPNQGKIYRVPIEGGSPQLVSDSSSAHVSWGDDDRILFTRAGGRLFGISSEGRDIRFIAAGRGAFGLIDVLPGSGFALVGMPRETSTDDPRIGVMNLADGSLTDLALAGIQPRYVRDGYILFASVTGRLFAAPFSLKQRKVTDSAVMLPGVSVRAGMNAKDFAVSDNGILLYHTAVDYLERQLVSVDSTGQEIDLGAPPRLYDQPRVSPNGRQIAVTLLCDSGGCGNISVFDIEARTLTSVTTDNLGKRPVWSERGDRIEFVRDGQDGSTIASRRWDGSRDSIVFAPAKDDSLMIREIIHDRRSGYALMRTALREGGTDLYVAPESNLRAMAPFAATTFAEGGARLAPGGRVVAYQTDESGRAEIYLRPIHGPGPRVPVSRAGGMNAVWSRDGRTIYYRTPERMIAAASVTLDSGIRVSSRRNLFPDVYERPPSRDGYDALEDGRLVFIKPRASRERITIVTNWLGLIGR